MIQINKLSKKYGKQEVLNNTNYKLPNSGLVCLLGASGCGKSTLLNMIAGFDSDYSGEIIVCGTDISKMSADQLCSYRRNNIGFIFQNYNLLTGYAVLENVLLACELNYNEDSVNTRQANEILERLGMSQKANEKIENLSGGQKQRVAIARALIGNPSIILADEPTGALDRKNSTEIMELLKQISRSCLILVITHDQKICDFADNVISIQDGKIVGKEMIDEIQLNPTLKVKEKVKVSAFHRGFKNFKVHLKRYIAVSLAISIGVLAFMLSLSSGNIMHKSIAEFKEKNTAFNNGYVKVDEKTDEIVELLKSDERIENVYEQYVIKNVALTINNKTETMAEKYPMPKAIENMSYGIMPQVAKNQIALSPSLAKKFNKNIDKLIGEKINLTFGEKKYTLTVSGIFNAGYDDFFVSSDIERDFYKTVLSVKPYSVSYDVKEFENIVSVSKMLEDNNIKAESAAKEVSSLQNTFENLNKLFLIVSLLILTIGLFISVILLVKFQNSRYREIGLLSALGFCKNTIRTIIISENVLLSVAAAFFNAMFIGVTYLITSVFQMGLIITAPQIILSILGTGFAVIIISITVSYKLIHTEPAVALRM